MTDNEIMQGMKWCYQTKGTCGDCPYIPNDIKQAGCIERLGNDVIDLIERQQTEIKALKMDKEQLESDISNALGNLDHMTQLYEGAIKEFAEKLKAKAMYWTDDRTKFHIYPEEILDELVKEMVGAENG